jgi:hypothetical protein
VGYNEDVKSIQSPHNIKAKDREEGQLITFEPQIRKEKEHSCELYSNKKPTWIMNYVAVYFTERFIWKEWDEVRERERERTYCEKSTRWIKGNTQNIKPFFVSQITNEWCFVSHSKEHCKSDRYCESEHSKDRLQHTHPNYIDSKKKLITSLQLPVWRKYIYLCRKTMKGRTK